MVQKEISKKTRIYTVTAVLLAILLVSMIYFFSGSSVLTPSNPQSSQNPNSPNNPINNPTGKPGQINLAASGMKTFSSLDELKSYISNTSGSGSSFNGGPLDSQFFGAAAPAPTAAPSSTGTYGMSPSLGSENVPAPAAAPASGYSTTNVQVAGVDEADTVKTDGQYVYVASELARQFYMYWLQLTNNQCSLHCES